RAVGPRRRARLRPAALGGRRRSGRPAAQHRCRVEGPHRGMAVSRHVEAAARLPAAPDDVSAAPAYDLPAELEELRTSVRRLAEERIAPNAAAADEREEYPWASWEAWRAAGFAGLPFAAAYGGQDGAF